MKSITRSLVFSLLFFVLAHSQATKPVRSPDPNAPLVDLGYVKYQGASKASTGINYFRGIPCVRFDTHARTRLQLTQHRYAASPAGALRWQRPVPIEWSNDYDSNTVYGAAAIGPACYQSLPQSLYMPYNESFAATPQGVSEDCLTVDVLVPTRPVSDRLPVMVQIHGELGRERHATWNAGSASWDISG